MPGVTRRHLHQTKTVRRAKIARDGLRLARRFRDHQDMILRFATDLTVGFTSKGRLCRVRGYADTALDALARGRGRPGEASINTAATVREL